MLSPSTPKRTTPLVLETVRIYPFSPHTLHLSQTAVQNPQAIPCPQTVVPYSDPFVQFSSTPDTFTVPSGTHILYSAKTPLILKPFSLSSSPQTGSSPKMLSLCLLRRCLFLSHPGCLRCVSSFLLSPSSSAALPDPFLPSPQPTHCMFMLSGSTV